MYGSLRLSTLAGESINLYLFIIVPLDRTSFIPYLQQAMVQQLTTDNFDDIVLGSDQPVLVDFYAEWCGPCKAAAPIIEEIADDYADKLTVGKVDIDAQPELTQRYNVMSIPTVLIFKDGEEVERKIGFGGRAGYEELIKKVLP